jgi:HD-GYP domain-containing protein (c-di-GMP phosphodiesterase class II)
MTSDPRVAERTQSIKRLADNFNCGPEATGLMISAALRLTQHGFPPDALETALCDAAELAGAERGFFHLYSRNYAGHDLIKSGTLKPIDPVELEIAETLASDVFVAETTLLNPEIKLDPRFNCAPGIDEMSNRYVMAAPLSTSVENKKQKIGVIYVDRPLDRGPFTVMEARLLESFGSMAALSIQCVRFAVTLRLAYHDTVQALVNALEAKDPSTRGHSIRVAEYAERCGKRFKLGMERLDMLRSAALLHDLGKIGIRDEILAKLGRLTVEEFEHVKRHPEISEAILSGLEFLTDEMNILIQHHERFDGTGYPRGLKGDEISLEGAILHVSESWDAMNSCRVYRTDMTMEQAEEELRRNAGTQFNPEVVEVFLRMIQEEGLISDDCIEP